MVNFILHIVEGCKKGTSHSIPPQGAVLIGRRKSCQLVLDEDDKVSGEHAEVGFEGSILILRDRDSTNGTRVDGKKISEIPISHADRFMIGNTTIELRDTEKAVPSDGDMGLTIDQAMLERSRRKSPLALVLLAVILIAGGSAWWFTRPGEGSGERGAGKKKALVVAGNKLGLDAASLEAGDSAWLSLANGAVFTAGGLAHSGSSAMQVVLGGSDAQGKAPVFAAMVLAQPISLSDLSGIKASAWVRTRGRVRVGLRLCFFNDAQVKADDDEAGDDEEGDVEEADARFDRRPDMVVGAPLTELALAAYQKIEVIGHAPKGSKELVLALVVVLPEGSTDDAEASVTVDDLAILSSGAESPGLKIGVRSVSIADASRSSLRIDKRPEEALTSISALPVEGADPNLSALARVLPLPLGDVFRDVSVVADETGFVLSAKGQGRLVLHVHYSAMDDGGMDGGSYLLARRLGTAATDAASFERHSKAGFFAQSTGLYWRGDNRRLLIDYQTPAQLRVEKESSGDGSEGFRFLLPMAGPVRFQLGFEKEILLSVRLARLGRNAEDEEKKGKALALYSRVLEEAPFDREALRTARARRASLSAEAQERQKQIRERFDEAAGFGYVGLLREVLEEIAQVKSDYAEEPEIQQSLVALNAEVASKLEELERGIKEERAEILENKMKFLTDQKNLREWIKNFIIERLPNTEVAKKLKQ